MAISKFKTKGGGATSNDRRGGHSERLGGLYVDHYAVKTPMKLGLCGHTTSAYRDICKDCYNRLPLKMQQSLWSRTHFIDTYQQVLMRAKAWLKENPVGR